MTGTQTKPRAVPTGTQTRKEVGLTKTVSEKNHVIPFVDSHSNVVTGKVLVKM